MSCTEHTENTKNRARLAELSIMNLFLCVIVIFIHVSSEPVTSLIRGSWQYLAVMIPWRLSSFAVQGFIFLSGLKICLGGKERIYVLSMWKRRFFGVVVPYLIWVLLYYIYFVRIGYFPFSVKDLFGYTLRGDLVSPFYFVIIIVQFYLLSPLFVKLVSKVRPFILLPCAFVINAVLWKGLVPALKALEICNDFKYMDRVFISYIFYFTAGCAAGRYYEKFKTFIKKNTFAILVLFVLSASGDILLYEVFSGKVNWNVTEIYHMFYCTCAIVCVYAVFLYVSQKATRLPKLIALADRSTYGVFLCHCLFIFIINGIMNRFGIGGIGIRYVIRAVFVYASAFTLCMAWRYARDKIRKDIFKRGT